ncbi:putative C6 finger domain protein [Penicillium brasilianum]|uniref:Putative C6 finger domain protein n=1 Tax=Penicillium brasilianum TaxID=104259 RepID=A0A1S9RZQ5_PENBI|nr:putative C6 finger domain protein [Penicillium brasilianum]
MAEPTEPNPGESANPPAETNAPAPAPVTSEPSERTEQPSDEANAPPPESTQVPAPTTEPQPESQSEPQPEPSPAPPAPPAPSEPPSPPATSALPTTNSNATQQEIVLQSTEESNHSLPAPSMTTSSLIPSLPAMDTSLPPIDSSHSLDDNELPSFDAALRAVSSSAGPDLSLPAIDTTLPSLDSSLPAIGTDIPTMDHPFGDDSHFGHHDPHDGSVNALDSGHDATHHGSINGSTHYPASSNDNYHTSNGNYQYTPNSQHDGRQQSQGSPQHQYQSQPQQSYQQQTSDMYHSTSGGFASVNANSNNNGQGQPGQVPQAPIGSPMPSNMPSMASMGQYMTGYPSNVSPSGMNSNPQMPYSLPGDPNKMLSGGRHKKEVKRRTKTGCLTCRKRRIKCDEGHPVCRNCVKSKRECLGYDPVFRPQASAPSAIQPAPNPQAPSLVVNPQGPPVPSAPSYPSAPPGYMPASSQPFAPSLHSESPSASTDHHDNGAGLDHSLANSTASHPSNMQSANDFRTQTSDMVYKAKNLNINDLIALRGIPPPAPHPIGSLPPGRLEEIQAVFLATYAPAIDKLLEVRWYTDKALSSLMADAQLMADYSALINAFNDWNLNDGNTVARLESFEASIIWRSMTLCRQVQNSENGQHGQDWNLIAATARLNAIEALLTWTHLDQNALSRALRTEAATPPHQPDQFMQRQLDFWSELGDFLTLHDNEASSAKQIDDTLGRCRQLLDTYENRDIIYSVAIARHLGQRWADFPNSLPKVGYTAEKESGTKLFVAQKFIEEEAEGKGTTQIYKRICCMAVRSWWVARE